MPTELDDRVIEVRARLLAHFDRHARDLAWRRTSDPYAIWVSEVMLQQTRVETAEPYFDRWMDRLPTVRSLAEADLETVLKLWEGLGYYGRARRLHQAARVVCSRYGGVLPTDPRELGGLPGVGRYTAGAVASIAFGHVVPAVDGNVRRVLSRLLDMAAPSASELELIAGSLVDPERPGDFNQALMELGATVCARSGPDCAACPLAEHCLACARGTQTRRPAPKGRREVPAAEFAVAIVVRSHPVGEDRVALMRRPEDGMLGGLWEFPAEALRDGNAPEEAARRAASRVALGATLPVAERRPPVDHRYTHLKATYHPYRFVVGEADTRDVADPAGELVWADRSTLLELPLPRAQRLIATDAGLQEHDTG